MSNRGEEKRSRMKQREDDRVERERLNRVLEFALHDVIGEDDHVVVPLLQAEVEQNLLAFKFIIDEGVVMICRIEDLDEEDQRAVKRDQ